MTTTTINEQLARERIGIALGRASMCWENVDKAGIFESERCAQIIDELLIDLELMEISEHE